MAIHFPRCFFCNFSTECKIFFDVLGSSRKSLDKLHIHWQFDRFSSKRNRH
jgi:hypothetical protein